MTCTCATCGLLAAEHPATHLAVEVYAKARATGTFEVHDLRPRPAQVFCLAGSPAFSAPPVVETAEQAVAALQAEHDCPQWVAWRRGHSPAEHEAEPEREALAALGAAVLKHIQQPALPRLEHGGQA
jgi:hypothetical protein